MAVCRAFLFPALSRLHQLQTSLWPTLKDMNDIIFDVVFSDLHGL